MLNDDCPEWIRNAFTEHFNEFARLAGEHNDVQLFRKQLNDIMTQLREELTPEQLALILEYEAATNYQHAVEKEWLFLRGIQEGMKLFKKLHDFML